MKLHTILDVDISETIITIKTNKVDDNIKKIQDYISSLSNKKLELYKKDIIYYIEENDIIFFETAERSTYAHTKDNVYQVKYKLYELINILPTNFIRVSKSNIININHIYSLNFTLTVGRVIEFKNTHKKVYVSRFYYNNLKEKIKEKK